MRTVLTAATLAAAVNLLPAPCGAETLESASAGASAPFEGLAEFPAAPVSGGAPTEDAGLPALSGTRPVPAEASAPPRPTLTAPRGANHSRKRTFDDGFMDGFGFVETPAVAVIDWNMSCRTGLCSKSPAVGAFGYGLGVLLMPLACVAGLVTAGWWAVFG